MAANGLRFDRFYSASAVCSPTRASCLTGRNPFRLGIPSANTGRLEFDETPLSEILSDAGYLCGHYGKWHLGSLTTLRNDSNRGGDASVIQHRGIMIMMLVLSRNRKFPPITPTATPVIVPLCRLVFPMRISMGPIIGACPQPLVKLLEKEILFP